MAVGCLALLAGVVALVVLLLIRYEPQHYAHAPLSLGDRSTKCSREFFTEALDLHNAVEAEREWYGRFTDEQINSFLKEDFIKMGLAEQYLPDGVSDPRIVFEPDRIHLAFRLRNGLLCTVISMNMKVWLTESEPNVVAVQLEGFRAGVLPISAQWLLEQLSEMGRQKGIEVNWYRHEGRPVALLRFQADQPHPTLQLQAVKIEQGALIIQGRSNEPAPVRTEASLPEAPQKPAVN
jgi:hypothetical protein